MIQNRPNGPFHLPFDYIHYQSLTNNGQEFTVSILTYTSILVMIMLLLLQDNIRRLTVTTNKDNPESTFDALMQAAVCTEVIGVACYYGYRLL